MEVSVESTGGLERRMRIRLAPEPLEEEFGRRLRKTAREARLNGFRPGKTPVKEIRRRFGPSIRAKVAVELMQSSFHDALHQEHLHPAGTPTFDPGDIQAESGLVFTATFEVFPDITLGDLEQLHIKRPEAEVTPEDVDAMIERLRGARTTWTAVARPAEDGDRITADLVQCDDGDFRHEGLSFVAGGTFFLPNVAAAAVGMATGDSRRVQSTFPEAMADESLRGREVEFDLTVREVLEGQVPELDDVFFETFDVQEGGEEAFREAIGKDLGGRLEGAIRAQVAEQVMNGIVALHTFDVPHCLVDERVAQIRQDMPQLFGTAGDAADVPQAALDAAHREAEKSLRETLLVQEIVERQGLAVDGAKVRARIEEQAASYENPEQVVNWYYSQDALLQRIESVVLKDQVVDYVLSVADVETVQSSHAAVMAGEAIADAPDASAGAAAEELPGANPVGETDADT